MVAVLPEVHQTPLPDGFERAMQARFAAQFTSSKAVCELHGRDESAFDVPPPQAVLFAQSTKDVADAMGLAGQFKVPVIPYGVGSSLEGHLLAVRGGMSLDVSQMNQILAVNPEDLTVTVQPGVTRKQLNDAINKQGIFFPIDPGADASLGGMCATRASGTNAVRYGTMRENVLALEVVLASGEVIRTGTRAKKSSAGYDLTRLMVGSEGTLGVMTEITLKVYPLPEAVSAAICSFSSLADAVATTIQLIQIGVPIARVELLDGNTVAMVKKQSGVDLPDGDMLLMEFHGSPAGVQEQIETVQAISQDLGAVGFRWANTPEERTRLWTARHNAYFAGIQSRPGCKVITTDCCVPISQLAECLLTCVKDANEAGVNYFLVGHVGDGNFHIGYLIDPTNDQERDLAETLNQRVVRHALRAGGTCTGEHGIGLHKMGFLLEETGEGAVAMMRAIKHALDPHHLLNPGKIFAERP